MILKDSLYHNLQVTPTAVSSFEAIFTAFDNLGIRKQRPMVECLSFALEVAHFPMVSVQARLQLFSKSYLGEMKCKGAYTCKRW
jgi:hypothetical protein